MGWPIRRWEPQIKSQLCDPDWHLTSVPEFLHLSRRKHLTVFQRNRWWYIRFYEDFVFAKDRSHSAPRFKASWVQAMRCALWTSPSFYSSFNRCWYGSALRQVSTQSFCVSSKVFCPCVKTTPKVFFHCFSLILGPLGDIYTYFGKLAWPKLPLVMEHGQFIRYLICLSYCI